MKQFSRSLASRVGAAGVVIAAGVWAVAQPLAATAQDENPNLVSNPSFEEIDFKRLKGPGQLGEMQTAWSPATTAPVDIFAPGVKNLKISVPSNMYGTQAAADGQNYIGIRAYSKDPKLPRTYAEIQLPEKLKSGQLYCVQASVSLSDLSRYAVNGIGVYFSERKMAESGPNSIVRKEAVTLNPDRVIEGMDGWEEVCGTFVAKGVESYATLGGFRGDSDATTTKPKKPTGVVGTVANHAYYYVDNVRIFAIEAKSQCGCGKSDEPKTDLVYGATRVLSENMTPEEITSNSAVYFAFLKRVGTSAGDATVAKLVEIMKANPSWKLRIVGHCDNDEFSEGKIKERYLEMGRQRAEQILSQFVAAGIDASRLVVESRENTEPAKRPGAGAQSAGAASAPAETEMQRAQNRRVQFEVIK